MVISLANRRHHDDSFAFNFAPDLSLLDLFLFIFNAAYAIFLI